MKPKDLKHPFRWQERRPFFGNRILFVPAYYDKHHEWVFPGWEHEDMFGRSGKVYVEYCAGNGAWIIAKAREFPDVFWVAVEKKFERARKIWSKMQNFQLKNLLVVCGEALTFTQHYLPSNSLDGIYVNFPDPWPKTKHAKNRLIQMPFIEQIARVVKGKGFATFVTDDVPYSQQIIQGMLEAPSWDSHFSSPYFVTDWPDYGSSYFDDLWRQKGCSIHYIQFIRNHFLGD